jgi:hypothetical protein
MKIWVNFEYICIKCFIFSPIIHFIWRKKIFFISNIRSFFSKNELIFQNWLKFYEIVFYIFIFMAKSREDIWRPPEPVVQMKYISIYKSASFQELQNSFAFEPYLLADRF